MSRPEDFEKKCSKMEENNFTLEFIELYRSLPALWNIRSTEYNNCHVKNQQYEILLHKFREKFPKATKRELTQKINSLRTGCKREINRFVALERNGSGLGEENEPNPIYLEAMDFPRDAESKAEDVENGKKRKKSPSNDELLPAATKRHLRPPEELQPIVDGYLLKLKTSDRTQRLLADRFINMILFEAQLGTLHRNSMRLNDEPPDNAQTTTTLGEHFPNSHPRDSSFTEILSPQNAVSSNYSPVPNKFCESSSAQMPVQSPNNVVLSDGLNKIFPMRTSTPPNDLGPHAFVQTIQSTMNFKCDSPSPNSQVFAAKPPTEAAHYFANFK